MNNLLEIHDLSVNYYTENGIVQALDKINIYLKKGEVVAIVGESGCGKSTLGKAILNLVPFPAGRVVEGKITFSDENILEMSDDECNSKIRGKKITIIPQDPFSSANPLFTIGAQLKDIFKNTQKDIKNIKIDVCDIFNKMQLPADKSLLKKYPHEMSGGQLQRIMIAASILPNPQLIIADEPTTSLDVTVEAQILNLFRNIVNINKVAVIYITHNLAVAKKVSNRIIVVYAGQVMESAPTELFFKKTIHPYAQKLLECLPSKEKEIKDIGGSVPNLIEPPKGCRFSPRCEIADDICHSKKPIMKQIEEDHFVSCHQIDTNYE